MRIEGWECGGGDRGLGARVVFFFSDTGEA